MKVAVLSTVPTCGKTTLVEILGGVYSRSQGRNTVILSTGDARDIMSMVTRDNGVGALDNAHIVKAMIDNAGDDAENLLNYGERAGDEHVYIFDVLNAAMSKEELSEFLLNAIKKIPADLTLIEICGDVNSELNRKVLEVCDCSLILVEHSIKGCKSLVQLIKDMPAGRAKVNRGIILSKYDATVCSDKAFASKLGMKAQNIFKFPYNPQVTKLAFNGELDRIVYNIIVGEHEVVNLRRACQDIMEYLFNSDRRKVVREIERWFR